MLSQSLRGIDDQEPNGPRKDHRVTVDLIASCILGVALFFAIRAFAFERYLVPSQSMEPFLHGDPDGGDRVLVDRTWRFRGGTPRRFDLLVVKARDQNLIKRTLSAPAPGGRGEYLAFHDGDLFVGGSRSRLDRVVKHPDSEAARSMRCTSHSWVAGSPPVLGLPVSADGFVHLAPSSDAPGAVPAGAWSTPRDLDASFLDVDERRLAAGRGTPRDLGVTIDLAHTPSPAGAHLVATLEVFGVELAFDAAVDGALELRTGGSTERLAASWWRSGDRSLRFGILDGRPFAQVVGDASRTVVVGGTELPKGPPLGDRVGRQNRITLAARGRELVLSAVTLFHDVHYRPEWDRTFRVESGELFLVGDHSYDSADSRNLGGDHAVTLDDVVGMPFAVVGPWRRMRWLPRTGIDDG
jgi:hypothetical protein